MSGRRISLVPEMKQPLLRSPIGIPLVFLTVMCGTLGWLVWSPYGMVLGVLPPAVVFGFAAIELRGTTLPKLPPAKTAVASPSPPLALGGRVDLVSDLYEAGVLTDDESNRLALSKEFASDWRRQMMAMDGRDHDQTALAELLGVDDSRVEMGWDKDGLFARLDSDAIGRWMSRAAFVADLTAVVTFRRHYPDWWQLTTADRNRVLGALRLSLHTCPTCDGAVEIDTERVDEDADRRKRHVTAACRGCNAELFDAVVEEEQADVSSTDTEAGTPPRSTR
ncbi:hypothetical protein [Haloferax profundi]|uniref:Uncharacterized protein n=1 Tax=Haloferax profundi TaxID=1544718 RepID=A0A0W1SN25_9EURY|nr:hypothetical protein AUR66_14720 [Haloferax profundi]